MKWDPDYAAGNRTYMRQYASHIQWATSTARRIYQMYNMINKYTLVFDIPQYTENNDTEEYPVFRVNASSLYYRDAPAGTIKGFLANGQIVYVNTDTNGNIISKKASLSGTEYLWYQIYVNGSLYWVASDFLERVK